MMTHLHVIMPDYCHITLIAFDCQPPRYHTLSVPNPHNCLFRRFEQKLKSNRNWPRFIRGGPVDVSLFCFSIFVAVLSWFDRSAWAGWSGGCISVTVGRVGGRINNIHVWWDGLQEDACVTVEMETTPMYSALRWIVFSFNRDGNASQVNVRQKKASAWTIDKRAGCKSVHSVIILLVHSPVKRGRSCAMSEKIKHYYSALVFGFLRMLLQARQTMKIMLMTR